MNAFIEMRKVYFENNQGVSFPEFYLKNHSFFNEENDEYRLSLINKMASIRRCYTDEKINEIQMVQALDDLGENVYLDRYIVDLVIKHKALINGNLLRKELLDRLVDPINTSRILCHLLDICIECDVPLLTGERLRQVFFQHEKDFDALSMLLAYLTHFCIDDFTDVLLEHLGRDIPENIKMQIIDGLLACHFNKKDLKQMLEQKLSLGSNTNIYLDYLNFTEGEEVEHDAKIVLFQTAFFGNPEFSGKGISGGLGTLLRTLGNQLVRHQEVSRVITLTINNNWQDGKPFMSYLADHHWLIRLPVYMDNEDQQAFVTKELMIKRSVAKFIKKWQINPDVFHVRYLDNASRTIGLLCKALGAKLVFTLTPDPHRSMVDQAGELAVFRIGETLERLNKIVVGDELLTLADGVVGIGADDVIEELERYFPQLKQPNNPFAFQMIGEGIDIETNPLNFELWTFLRAHAFTHSIDRSHESKPVILNVGRLNRQKGQDRLIKVWGESRLWKDFNLIIIGGNREQLDDEATKMMKSFDEYIKDNPHLKGRFAHVEALPNHVIRSIEKKIMERIPVDFPNVYICSSLKEEFGISILEALFERFLVFGPIKGGVKTYLENGVNGFLVDTSNWCNLLKDVEATIYQSNRSIEDFKRIQYRGQLTVLEKFSIKEIANELLDFYLALFKEE